MNRIALITGASRGLGRILASFLAGADYDLVLTARTPGALERAAADVAAEGPVAHRPRLVALAGDVADPAHRRRLVEAAADLGGLDLLVNNASELGPSPLPELADLPLASLERVLAVNVVAPLGLVQAALPLLERRNGMIVNVSSDAATGGYAGWGAYGASKAALDLLSRTLATELRARGVTSVSVDPGDMRTAMHQAAFPDQDISDRPDPDVTLPFWSWLLSRERAAVNGRRYQAQGDRWEEAA